MTTRTLAFIIAALCVLGMVLSFVSGVPVVILAIIGVPLVLLGPGTALLIALRKIPGLPAGPAVALVLGVSVAVVVLIGVVLAALPLGLTATSAPFTVALATLVLAIVGAVLPRERVAEPRGMRRTVGTHRGRVPALAMSLVIAIAAVVVAHVAADRTDSDQRAIQFSLLPSSTQRSLHVLVENAHDRARYRVQVVSADGADEKILAARTIELGVGDSRTLLFALPATRPSSLRVLLFAGNATDPIRAVAG